MVDSDGELSGESWGPDGGLHSNLQEELEDKKRWLGERTVNSGGWGCCGLDGWVGDDGEVWLAYSVQEGVEGAHQQKELRFGHRLVCE